MLGITPDSLGSGWCPQRADPSPYQRSEAARGMALKLGGYGSFMTTGELLERIHFAEEDHILLADFSGNPNCDNKVVEYLVYHGTRTHPGALYALNVANTSIGPVTPDKLTGDGATPYANWLTHLLTMENNDLQHLSCGGCKALSAEAKDSGYFWKELSQAAATYKDSTFRLRCLNIDNTSITTAMAQMLLAGLQGTRLEVLSMRATGAANFLSSLKDFTRASAPDKASVFRSLDISGNDRLDFALVADIAANMKGSNATLIVQQAAAGTGHSQFFERLLSSDVTLQRLDVAGTTVPADAFAKAAASPPTARSSLRELILDKIDLKAHHAQSLQAFLSRCPDLVELSLNHNPQLGTTASVSPDAIAHTVALLATVGAPKRLQRVDVSDCNLPDRAVIALAKSLHASRSDHRLERVDVSVNRLSAVAFHAMTSLLLTQPRLAHLNLIGCITELSPAAHSLIEMGIRRKEIREQMLRCRGRPAFVDAWAAEEMPTVPFAVEGYFIAERGPYAQVEVKYDAPTERSPEWTRANNVLTIKKPKVHTTQS